MADATLRVHQTQPLKDIYTPEACSHYAISNSIILTYDHRGGAPPRGRDRLRVFRTIVQTNYYSEGVGNKEQIHVLGFDASDEFHEYVIVWENDAIEWRVDGKVVRREGFPKKPMFLYASVWDASCIADRKYRGTHQPYVCMYKDIHVPVGTAVVY
ncbi:hypothetical protein VNO78_25340 [Psophocarpus tetragonolobus]|uniref:GH16 domain-containing protein n=1 Tax=Psophocarpus tetragonolobus TaxID=3891 RepID=A0AAN9XFB1_PSOTE